MSDSTRTPPANTQPMRAMMNRRMVASQAPATGEVAEPTIENLQARIRELEAQLAARETEPGADRLTGLANKATLEEELARSIATARRYGRRHALLLVDIDGFSALNEKLGWELGDSILQHVARLLRQNIRPTDIAARYENDMFAIVLNELRADANATMRATELATTLARTPWVGSSRSIQLSAQLGVAAFGLDDDVESIVASARTSLEQGLADQSFSTGGGLRM